MSEIADAVEGTVADLFGDSTTEDAPAAEAAMVAAAPEAEVEQAAEFPDWEAATRDLYLEDEDETPDFTAEADAELAQAEESLAPSEYDDEDTARLKREAIAAKKQAEHFRNLHLRTARKQWEADVKGQPWAEFAGDLSQIQASSHRDFLKQARTRAKANYEIVKPHLDRVKAAQAQAAQQATVEAKAQVQAAWGKPTVGGPQVPMSAEQRAANDLDRARRRRDMTGVVKAYIDQDLI